MKRKAAGSPSKQQPPSGRQPVVSCDSCRRKKLKCDRGQPCASCRVRGLACTGQPRSRFNQQQSSPTVNTLDATRPDKSILGRLALLEHAVFASRSVSRPTGEFVAESESHFIHGARTNTPSLSVLDRERYQTAKFFDSAYNKGKTGDPAAIQSRLDFRVASTPRQPITTSSIGSGSDVARPRLDGDGQQQQQQQQQQRPILMMSREEALSLLQDFVNNAYHLLPIVHKASVQVLINDFYSRLAQGDSTKVNLAHAALILSISATSAYFWYESATCHNSFESDEGAAQASLAWRQSALDVLDEFQRIGSSCLEEAQARAIIAYLIYNIEGQSARFRLLHSCSIAACREISAHLVDSPGSESSDDEPATKEVKRRLWWHVAATDWMLGLNGGPLEGTYTVNPRHMNVAKPRNLNDNDLAVVADGLTYPPNVLTQMSCFLQRIRLAEVCRAIIDARVPGLPDVEIADYNQVLALDRLFERAICEFPPFLALNAPIQSDAPQSFYLQRAIIHLGFYSRRARLHRPFLLRSDADRGQAGDTKYHMSRAVCLRSARMVLKIATGLLESSFKRPIQPQQQQQQSEQQQLRSFGPPVHRLGAVIIHTFMACAVLALHTVLRANRTGADGRSPSGEAVEEESSEAIAGGTDTDIEIHEELESACRLLTAAGEESTVAAGLVRGLTGVLRRYCVRDINDNNTVRFQAGGGSSSNRSEPDGNRPGTSVPRIVEFGSGVYQSDAGFTGAKVIDEVERGRTGPSQPVDRGGLGDYGLGLDGIWDDFLGTMPMGEDWDQLFAGLDSYCGPT